jgi:hypothetical protein
MSDQPTDKTARNAKDEASLLTQVLESVRRGEVSALDMLVRQPDGRQTIYTFGSEAPQTDKPE